MPRAGHRVAILHGAENTTRLVKADFEKPAKATSTLPEISREKFTGKHKAVQVQLEQILKSRTQNRTSDKTVTDPDLRSTSDTRLVLISQINSKNLHPANEIPRQE
jgi:hypothetical protein